MLDNQSIEVWDKINDSQYKTLSNSLEALNQYMLSTSAGTTGKDAGNKIEDLDIESLKVKIDYLIEYDMAANNSSHLGSGSHTNTSDIMFKKNVKEI